MNREKDPAPPELVAVDPADPYRDVNDDASLREALNRDLSYCPCGCDDAIPVLHTFLRHVQRRAGATNDAAAFSEHSQKLDDLIVSYGEAAISTWFVYLLEQAGVIYHGNNLFDIWLPLKGQSLLRALDRCKQGNAYYERR